MATEPAADLESAFVVRGEVTPDAITSSLRGLLSTRQRTIPRHRYTELDTFDGRLRQAGGRLTRSGENGSSTVIWSPTRGRRPFASTLEQPLDFAWDLPRGPLHEALTPIIGVRRLLAQGEVEEFGSLLEVLDARGKTVARLRIESGRVRGAAARRVWRSLPTIVTVAGLRGYEEEFERLVPVVKSRPGLEPCPGGLSDAVRRQLGLSEPLSSAPPTVALAPGVRADVGARRIHLALLDLLVSHEPGIRARLDTEFLHDFRVVLRRIRSLLGQIRHVFPPSAVEHFAEEFSWLGTVTGPARDVDVLALALRQEWTATGSDDDMNALVAFVSAGQDREYRSLLDALDSDRYHQLLVDWRRFLNRKSQPVPVPMNATRPLADVVSERARRRSRRLLEHARGRQATAAELHEIRIEAKKLRYLLDLTPDFYPAADLRRVLNALRRLQRVLGAVNDSHVQELRLLACGPAVSAAGAPSGAVMTLGRLAERCRQRRDGLTAEVNKALAQFAAPGTRAACRRAFKTAASKERA